MTELMLIRKRALSANISSLRRMGFKALTVTSLGSKPSIEICSQDNLASFKASVSDAVNKYPLVISPTPGILRLAYLTSSGMPG